MQQSKRIHLFVATSLLAAVANASFLNIFSDPSEAKVVPIPANPCVEACVHDPSSSDCAQCCRTVPHEVDWKCENMREGNMLANLFFKRTPAACCSGSWNPSCWDTPSASNFYHACASCCGSCSDVFGGCADSCGGADGECDCGGCSCADGSTPSNESCADGSTFECRESDSVCFPSDALVVVRGESEPVRMSNLKKGDQVLVQGGAFETVYAFGGHQNHDIATIMLSIKTEIGATLTLSENHWIPTAGDNSFKRAKDIRVGDILTVLGKNGERESAVVRVDRAKKVGLFNPLTPSGTIVVNSVAVSCYASQASPAYMHALLTPARLAAGVFPKFTVSAVEMLGNNGKTIPPLVRLGDKLLFGLETILGKFAIEIAATSATAIAACFILSARMKQ